MRIVAPSAPKLPAAFAGTLASSQLLGVAHGFDALAILFSDIDRDRPRQILAGMIILQGPTRVQNADFTFQVTLFANAIPSGRWQPDRIDNISCRWMLHMLR